MALEIVSVGGYSEVGKNMTAIRASNEVVILDMGIHLENYIRLTEEEDIIKRSVKELTTAGAIPDIAPINNWRSLASAIVPTHAHLDHSGAIPFLASKFGCPVIGTPFTIEVLKRILKDAILALLPALPELVSKTYFEQYSQKVLILNIQKSQKPHKKPQKLL